VTARRSPLLERLAATLASDPELPFARLRIDGAYRTVTRAELAGRMGAYAVAWQDAGVGRGDIVFIILRHGTDAMASFLAAMWIGAVPSFLPCPNPRQDLALYRAAQAAVLARTRARALLTETDLAGDLGTLDAPDGTAVLVPPPQDHVAVLPPPGAIAADDGALLQHSSGTTGLKKGVMLSHRTIMAQLDAYVPTLGLDDSSCIATWLPLYHDMGLIACFLLPVLNGISIVMLDPFEWVARPQLLLEGIEEFSATHVWMPNFAFAHLVRGVPRAIRHDLSSIRMLIGSSETNRPDTHDRFIERFGADGLTVGAMQTSYGMAETTFAVCQSRRGVPPRRIGIRVDGGRVVDGDTLLMSCGEPLPGVSIGVLHDGVIRFEERLVGEFCVGSPFNFSGYFGAEVVAQPHHRTGDIGFMEGGEVFVLGRTKDVIIVNGRNLYAHDIEAAVNEVPGIHPGRCVALGLPSAQTGSEDLVVIGETTAPAPELSGAVNRAVLAQLGVPCSRVVLVAPGWLIKTTSGKVARGANQAKLLQEHETRP